MSDLAIMQDVDQDEDAVAGDAGEGFIALSDPDITLAEI